MRMHWIDWLFVVVPLMVVTLNECFTTGDNLISLTAVG